MHNTPNKPNRRPRLAAAILALLAAVLIPAAIYAACNVDGNLYDGISISGPEYLGVGCDAVFTVTVTTSASMPIGSTVNVLVERDSASDGNANTLPQNLTLPMTSVAGGSGSSFVANFTLTGEVATASIDTNMTLVATMVGGVHIPGAGEIEGQDDCIHRYDVTIIKVELVVHESGRSSNDIIKDETDDKGQRNYLIAFHKASDGNKIDLVLDAPSGAGNFFYEFRDSANLPLSPPRSGMVPVGIPVIVTDLPISDGNESFDYTIRYGIDYDGNGTLSISEILESGGGIPRIYGVSQVERDLAHGLLTTALATSIILQSYGLEVGLQDSAYQMNFRFMTGNFDAFNNAAFIPVANTPANTNVLGTSITHKFGYSPGGNVAANLRSFLFANGTDGSDHFESNPNLQNHVQSAYNAITFEEVNAAYVDDSTSIILPLDPVSIEWGIDSGGVGDAPTSGTLSVNVAKISTSEYTISAPAIVMVTRDLFDFNYFNTFTVLDVNLPPKAASVQCGYGVGGNTSQNI